MLSNTISFGRSGPAALQQLFEMRQVVVAEDLLLAAGLADALDHRIVVEASDRIRQFGMSLAMVEMPVSFET